MINFKRLPVSPTSGYTHATHEEAFFRANHDALQIHISNAASPHFEMGMALQHAKSNQDTRSVSALNARRCQHILEVNETELNCPFPGSLSKKLGAHRNIYSYLLDCLNQAKKNQSCTEGWTGFFIQQILFLSTPVDLRRLPNEAGSTKIFPGSFETPSDEDILNWTYVEGGRGWMATSSKENPHVHDLDINDQLTSSQDPYTHFPVPDELTMTDICISMALKLWFYATPKQNTMMADGNLVSKGNALRHDFFHRWQANRLLSYKKQDVSLENSRQLQRIDLAFLRALINPKISDKDKDDLVLTYFVLCHEKGIHLSTLNNALTKPDIPNIKQTMFGDKAWGMYLSRFKDKSDLAMCLPKRHFTSSVKWINDRKRRLYTETYLEQSLQNGARVWRESLSANL